MDHTLCKRYIIKNKICEWIKEEKPHRYAQADGTHESTLTNLEIEKIGTAWGWPWQGKKVRTKFQRSQ